MSEVEAPVADRFIRKRLTEADLRAMPRGSMLLLSTRWSTFQSLQPVLLETVDASGNVAYTSAVPGHPDWPAWVDLTEGRFYRLEG